MEMIDTTKLTQVLRDAVAQARIAVADMDEHGTCNLDSPVLYVTHPSHGIEVALDRAGCTYWYSRSSWHRGYVLGIGIGGQGNTRTTAAEVVSKALEEHGFDSGVWYQMD